MNQLKTREQLAIEYGVSTKTIQRRMKLAGFDFGKRLLSPEEQDMIKALFFRKSVALRLN